MGFVQQDTPFLEYLTVRETLRFAARLRLPENVPRATKLAIVEDVIADLDLAACANTLVGRGGESGGISGGERRRLALGMELLFNPQILLVDEVGGVRQVGESSQRLGERQAASRRSPAASMLHQLCGSSLFSRSWRWKVGFLYNPGPSRPSRRCCCRQDRPLHHPPAAGRRPHTVQPRLHPDGRRGKPSSDAP